MLEILNKTTNNPALAGLFVVRIKNGILGRKYDLSLVFVDSRLSAKLNQKYRNKKGPTNVLSFPLDKENGEIFIDLDKVKEESENLKISQRELVASLLIHSFLHLKGFVHGEKMQKIELKLNKKYLKSRKFS